MHLDRLDKLLESQSISYDEYKCFKKKGALGSHLENLERKWGYKGFNQNSVSDILNRINPRKN